MGFLLGAFGKLAAGRRVRQLQAKMMRVQSKLRRVTRQIESVSKMLETQKKMELNNISLQSQAGSSYIGGEAWAQANGFGDVYNLFGGSSATNVSSLTDMDDDTKLKYSAYQTAVTNAKATNEMSISQMKTQIEEKYEALEDALLEPLKQEEDELETEKDSLESQIQIAQNDYEACKEMEKAGAKTMAPSYTGSVS